MKLRQPRITPEQKVQILTDYNSNMKISEILKRNNISQGTLYRIIKEKV
jgi:hypothetical protein